MPSNSINNQDRWKERNSTNIVTIDLQESKDAKSFNSGNLIHLAEFYTAEMQIMNSIEKAKSHIDKIKSFGLKKTFDRPHEAITILGTRGSGKTTFLLSLLNKLKKNNDVIALEIIDPTLIEEKGHIFLYVISAIKELVDIKLDNSDCNPTSSDYLKRKDWEQTLLKFSTGLPSIDGVGTGVMEMHWQDSEYIMHKGIQAVSAARELGKNFNNFIYQALSILDKKAFIISFDDIDIDFKKGWPVLETIRKYFTTPLVITILSGDLKLYSLAIRKQHWQNFGKSLLINEAEKQDKLGYFNNLVTEMEGQYLQKVLKPERRIYLPTLGEKIKTGGNKIEYFVKTLNKIYEVPIFYFLILAKFGIKNKSQAGAYKSFLLSLPIRSQIQFLNEFVDENREIENIKLTDAFLSDLFEKRVNVNLAISTSNLLNVVILELLLREKLLGEAYQLQPTTNDVSLNSSLTALSFLFSKATLRQNSHLIFDYIIKIAYTRNIQRALNLADSQSYNLRLPIASLDELIKHSGIFQDKVLRDVVGNMTAFIRALVNSNEIWGGIIPLFGLAAKSRESETNVAYRIDSVFNYHKVSNEKRILGFIPLSICSYANKSSSLACYSIFTLIGAIGEIIRKVNDGDIANGLIELSQIRTYTMPDFETKIDDVNEPLQFGDEDHDTKPKFNTNEDNLSFILEYWVDSYSEIVRVVAPHLLGKITTRFFYALGNIEEKDSPDSLGKLFHAQIIALLNAILIEDIKENAASFNGININNTNYSDLIFINNLKKAVEIKNKENLGLSRWMLSCPLFHLYLNINNTELYYALSQFCRPNFEIYDKHESNIFDLLSLINIKGSKHHKHSDDLTSLLNYYPELISYLKKRKIPFSWFSMNKSKIIANNKKIRDELPEVFNNGSRTSHTIRKFREYLNKNQIEW